MAVYFTYPENWLGEYYLTDDTRRCLFKMVFLNSKSPHFHHDPYSGNDTRLVNVNSDQQDDRWPQS